MKTAIRFDFLNYENSFIYEKQNISLWPFSRRITHTKMFSECFSRFSNVLGVLVCWGNVSMLCSYDGSTSCLDII